MTEEPTLSVMGFDPVTAFDHTLSNLVALVDAVNQSPSSLPTAEILRAVRVSIDTLETITELCWHGLVARLPDEAISEAQWAEHCIENDALVNSRSEKQEAMYRIGLIQGFSQPVDMNDLTDMSSGTTDEDEDDDV